MRIGTGFDAHRYSELPATTIRLGGVDVPYSRQIEAHSDGDVVIHALCDALLGALAMGDIGQHFPDTDDQYSGVDSRLLLRHCYKLIQDRGYQLGNCDITLIAQRPRVADFIQAMRETLAADLGVLTDQVSVKATTTEKMGFVGREEGLAAEAVVLLRG